MSQSPTEADASRTTDDAINNLIVLRDIAESEADVSKDELPNFAELKHEREKRAIATMEVVNQSYYHITSVFE